MGGRGSLARQLLAWQLVVVTCLLCAVGALAISQAGSNFRATEGRRMLSVAENVAAVQIVRDGFTNPFRREALGAEAEKARGLSGATFVVMANRDRKVITSPDPAQLGAQLDIGASTAMAGRAWVGEIDDTIVAHVPVLDDRQQILGIIVAGVQQPGLFDGWFDSVDNGLRLLGVALVIGVTGSLLLARRVKNQTLGLEPHEITALVENREALLHGIKEGVVGLDLQHRITLVNDHARSLLAFPEDAVGRSVEELSLDARLHDVLTGRSVGADQIVLAEGRVLTLNRMPIEGAGAVVTLRDRTELMTLQDELVASKRATDTLRAQAHEFSNRLHTIAGLVELEEYQEVRGYISRISSAQDQWRTEVTERIGDPAVAALLIAKASLAAERGAGLRMAEGSQLGRSDELLSTDLVTVLGNLVDNALDALGGERGWIEVGVRQENGEVRVIVRDSGPGVAPEIAEEVFRHGFTTKAALHGQRGLGLALIRQTCLRRGGSVQVHNEDGAVFTARLPL